MQQVNLGMIGGGTVGSGVFHALELNGGLMAARIGVKINVKRIAVKAVDEPRPYPIPTALMTTDWRSVVEDPQVDLVTELVGGTTLARTMIAGGVKARQAGDHRQQGAALGPWRGVIRRGAQHGTNLYYEASVCGGIPIIKALREGFVGNRITHIYGIVNGTCNYILTRMKLEGADFAAVLKDAQAQGYAEAEPSLDMDGHDALHKIGILASLAHGFWVTARRHLRRGHPRDYADGHPIRQPTGLHDQAARHHQAGTRRANRYGRPAKVGPAHRVQVSVYPTLVPNTHVLASVNHVFNAVFVRGDMVGDTLFYGRGAGKDATASAVLSDLADAALDLKFGTKHRVPPFVPHERDGAVLSIDDVESRYFVRLEVQDVPGTLARIATILGHARIGISSVIQPEGHEGASVPLILMLHTRRTARSPGRCGRSANCPWSKRRR